MWSNFAEKALEVLIDRELNMTECSGQQRRSAASWSVLRWAQPEIKKSDFSSTQHFLGPHLDYCVQFGAHQYKKHFGWLEQVQQRAKMLRELEHSPCDRRLREWDLFILQSEMFRLDIKKIFSPWGQSPLEQEPREAMQSMFGGCKEVVKIWLAKLGLTCSIEQLGVILELVLLSAGDWTRWRTNTPSNLWYLTILCVCIKYKSMENQNVS